MMDDWGYDDFDPYSEETVLLDWSDRDFDDDFEADFYDPPPNYSFDEILEEEKRFRAEELKRHERPGPRLHFRSYGVDLSSFKYYRPACRAGFGRPTVTRVIKRIMRRAERRLAKELLREALEIS